MPTGTELALAVLSIVRASVSVTCVVTELWLLGLLSGVVDVTVTTADGTSATEAADGFTYLAFTLSAGVSPSWYPARMSTRPAAVLVVTVPKFR